MSQPKLTAEIVNAAIAGFEAQKTHIDSQIADLRKMLDGRSRPAATAPNETAKPRRKRSAAVRRQMKIAQQRRWAKIKGVSEALSQPVTSQVQKPIRRLSAAGRKAIIAATKKRWALKRAESERSQSPVAKEAARKNSVAKRAAKGTVVQPPRKKRTVWTDAMRKAQSERVKQALSKKR